MQRRHGRASSLPIELPPIVPTAVATAAHQGNDVSHLRGAGPVTNWFRNATTGSRSARDATSRSRPIRREGGSSASASVPPRSVSMENSRQRLSLPPLSSLSDADGSIAGSSTSSPSRSHDPRFAGPELQANDWEHAVAMYITGEGTADGVPLRDIARGDGRRVEDRKLLEKRRTIGKTYVRLGRGLFERTIGYKIEGNHRRKQRMYLVIARCRVISQLCRNGSPIPTNPDELSKLIENKLAEKAARKHSPEGRGSLSFLYDAPGDEGTGRLRF